MSGNGTKHHGGAIPASHALRRLREAQPVILRRIRALEKMEDLDKILERLAKRYDKGAKTCETCGRAYDREDHKVLLQVIRELRAGITTQVSIVKDLFLVFQNHEFQTAVLEALNEESPELRRRVVQRLQGIRESRASVGA